MATVCYWVVRDPLRNQIFTTTRKCTEEFARAVHGANLLGFIESSREERPVLTIPEADLCVAKMPRYRIRE